MCETADTAVEMEIEEKRAVAMGGTGEAIARQQADAIAAHADRVSQ